MGWHPPKKNQMDDPGPDALGASLLQWVKSFEGVRMIAGWEDLDDGRKLWTILAEVDREYFSARLPEPEVRGDWTRKWQNLKFLERQISVYYRDVCNGGGGGGGDELSARKTPDLKAIAAEGSVPDLEKLIMIMIRAAMASPESNQRMAQRLMSLGREHAMIIANELRNLEEVEDTESEPASRDESANRSENEALEMPRGDGRKDEGGAGMYRDPLLEREEEVLRAEATIDQLQANQVDAQRQLQEIRQDKERLQEAFDSYRAEIDTQGRKSGSNDAFNKLQRQTESDRAYIDDLEGQLQSSRGTMESYEKQLERLRSDHEASQKLRDDLQMLRAENEDLNQKVKANENLKKKIQALQEQEKTNVSLREQLKQSSERIDELERLQQVQAGLEKEIIEKKGLIRNQEYQITELSTIRKHAEYDARVLAQKLEAARERHDRDHEAIEDLRAKLREDTSLDQEAAVDESAQDVEKQTDTSPPALDERAKQYADKLALLERQLEEADARLKQTSDRNALLEERSRITEEDTTTRQQKLADQEKTILDLRREVEAATTTTKQQKNESTATPTADMAALQRENHLMATAWYDLTSRLQGNGVSLGRRRPDPKSWIGKQRALVGPNVGLGSLRRVE